MRRAYLYRDAKMEEQYVAGLRYIMNKYPKSSESSTAHVELQKMGIATGGAVAADNNNLFWFCLTDGESAARDISVKYKMEPCLR